MKLSHKDLSFLIEAVEFHLGWYADQIDHGDPGADELSDLINDRIFLRALLSSLEQAKAEGTPGPQ